jgi:hypothetical protein
MIPPSQLFSCFRPASPQLLFRISELDTFGETVFCDGPFVGCMGALDGRNGTDNETWFGISKRLICCTFFDVYAQLPSEVGIIGAAASADGEPIPPATSPRSLQA